jgi:hypothetical protein
VTGPRLGETLWLCQAEDGSPLEFRLVHSGDHLGVEIEDSGRATAAVEFPRHEVEQIRDKLTEWLSHY